VSLAKPSASISLMDVLRGIEEHKLCLNSCIATPGKCAREPFCPVYRSLLKTQRVIDRSLSSISFEALARHHLRLCRTRRRSTARTGAAAPAVTG
jgi:DNA-binding IscR family transcriptional regulator